MAATDHQYTTTQPGSDALVAAITSAIGETLLDRSGGGILADPNIAMGFEGKEAFMGALAGKKVYVATGADKFLAVAEGSAFAYVDLASSTSTLTPTRRGYLRAPSDMLRSLDKWGLVDWAMYAMDATVGWQQTVVSAIAALSTSLSATGGNTGGAASWGAIVADYMTLGAAKAQGPYTLITRPSDWGAVAQDAFSLGGWVANAPETNGYTAPVNPGYVGTFMGGNLRVYTSDELPTSGGDTVGMMFGSGCVRWNAHMPAPSPASHPILWTPAFGSELQRDATKSEDIVANSTHLGTAIGLNGAGIQVPFVT